MLNNYLLLWYRGRRLPILFMTLIFSLTIQGQQQKIVTGKITDTDGQPLAAASVGIKGSNTGTITDADGTFTIACQSNSILVFSFSGFETQEIPVRSTTNWNIRLTANSALLSDVIVVGYGTQFKKKLSTSISKISAQDINKLPVSSLGDALTGLAAGVQVQSGAGSTPGAAPTIRIRGSSSLGASNEPLYVVDGFPLPGVEEFSKINVSDIQSIEVLKDAASAAIYGSRGASGVVIVTTKRGQAGKTSFTASAYTGVQNVAKRMKMMNKDQYIAYAKDARNALGLQYPDIFDTPEKLPDTDWQDVIFRTAPMSKMEIRAQGGTEKVQFSVSGSYLNQVGSMVGTNYQVANLRANLDAQLTKSLKVGFDLAPSFTWRDIQGTPTSLGPASYSPVYTALLMPPVVPVYLDNGDYGQNNVLPYTQYGFAETGIFNPLAYLELNKNQVNTFGSFNNLFLEWNIIKGLTLRTQGGLTVDAGTNNAYVPSTLAYGTSPFANLSTPVLTGISSSVAESKTFDWIWQNTLNYTKSFESGHNLSALLLASMQKYYTTTTRTQGKLGTFTNDLIHNPTASSDQTGSLSYGLNDFVSYAARINYDYKAKYLFSGSIRSDGSSKFGPNNRFGVFQSYSAGWRLSEEPFMQNQQIFSELKVRASYGETGNANIGDFTWMSRIAYGNYSLDDQRVAGVYQSGFLNQNLTWEKNRQTDIGLEMGFLNDRIYISLDAYNKITKGMLFSKSLPAIVGYASSFTTNAGNVRNRGIEADITSRNFIGAFKWSTNLNVSFNKSKVLDLGGRESLPTSSSVGGWPNSFKIEVGKPLGNMYGFIIDGVFKSAEELANSPKWPGSGVGDYKIRDVNGDGNIDEGDRTVLGNGFPDFIYGMTNNFSYNNFDLSIIVQGVLGNSIINGAGRHTELWIGRFNAVEGMDDNYFKPDDPTRDVKYARVGPRSGFGAASNLHSYVVYNGSFLRVRNLTLGYAIPAKKASSWFLQSARIYVTAQNLLTLSQYVGYNPEVSQYGDSVYQPGVDQGTYPVNRSFMLGIDIGF
ncbi:MAG: TonB-dependent receptor [Chitinophagaceae bacterium]|nr:TonB-dependent receptor [Chitinophagaceae bacterium]